MKVSIWCAVDKFVKRNVSPSKVALNSGQEEVHENACPQHRSAAVTRNQYRTIWSDRCVRVSVSTAPMYACPWCKCTWLRSCTIAVNECVCVCEYAQEFTCRHIEFFEAVSFPVGTPHTFDSHRRPRHRSRAHCSYFLHGIFSWSFCSRWVCILIHVRTCRGVGAISSSFSFFS